MLKPLMNIVFTVSQYFSKFHFPTYCVQTDNGQEFTKRLFKTHNPTLTLFEKTLKNMVFYTNLSNPILLVTTAKSNVLTEKITSISTLFTLFILSMNLRQYRPKCE